MSSFAPTKVPKMHECRKERKQRTYRKSNQRAHHTHTTKMPPKFRPTTIAHSKFPMCIDAKFPHALICTPKFRNALKSKVSDYLKRPSKFPPTQQSTPKFRKAPKSKVSDYLKRPSKFPPTQQCTPKFPYTHEVREFLTIQHPNAPDQTPTPHPRSILGSLIASKIPTFQGKISHLGVSTDHHPRHRERAVIRLCACRKMPNTLADVNLP